MALEQSTRQKILDYAAAHVGDDVWHKEYFSFISNKKLADRLGEEFRTARLLYKILEGLEAKGALLRAQIRMQIFAYASIYEATIHHLLFDTMKSTPEVAQLTEYQTKKQISIPAANQQQLEKYLAHNGKKIIPTFETTAHTEQSKVRFDKKAECAYALGFIKQSLKNDLIEFYEARNAIHIHAEIRKSLVYQIDLSKRAYRRMKPFREQIVDRLTALGLPHNHTATPAA